MRILFVLENYLPHIGGVEVVFQNLAEGLARDPENRVDIVTHRMRKTPAYEIMRNVHVHRVKVPAFLSRYFFTFLSIPRVFRLARGADLIHTTTYNAAFPAWLASKVLRKPALITVHEIIGRDWLKNRTMGKVSGILHWFLERAVISLHFDRFICDSDYTLGRLRSVRPKAAASRVYPGLDHVFWRPQSHHAGDLRRRYGLDDSFVLLFFGRPGFSKGLEVLIRAIPKIARSIPKSHCLCIVSRDKTYRSRYDAIVKLVQGMNLQGRVTIIDPVPKEELPRHLLMADCVAVPSLSEGFGYSAVEACAMERPLVASRTASLPEVVWGKVVLVEPASPDALAEGIIKAYRRDMVILPSKAFPLEHCQAGYLKVYEELARP